MYIPLFEQKLDIVFNKKITQNILDYCIENSEHIIPCFKKLKTYTSNYRKVTFTDMELKIFNKIPNKPNNVDTFIYRGINLRKKKVDEIKKSKIYKPKHQFSSWTTKKNLLNILHKEIMNQLF